jgi:hypothetical protein
MLKTQNKNLERNRSSNTKRLIGFIAVGLVLILFELFLGSKFESNHVDNLLTSSNLAIASYKSPNNNVFIPQKKIGQKRIIYISNSHAATGGKVTRHLQHLLDVLQPNNFEIIDLSEPGIFAPDILQRTLFALNYQPDLIIFSVAYISFSDRMKLSLQSKSAHAFFKNGIFTKLSLGFWIRNYDLGTYADTFIKSKVNLYRYRNNIRDLWEEPAVKFLQKITDNRQILFLITDEKQTWRFPEGYDKNLFQWNLYSSGRKNHLVDMQEAIKKVKETNVPLIGLNLPIDWTKSVYKFDEEDYLEYRKHLKFIFGNDGSYHDYEEWFPKDFSTYDALHPTWYGAKLHSLDLVFLLLKNKYLERTVASQIIMDTFDNLEPALSEDYINSFNELLDSQQRTLGFQRFDIFDPENVADLMFRLRSSVIGSPKEQELLYLLSRSLRYWIESDFKLNSAISLYNTVDLVDTINDEIDKAYIRATYFRKRLVEIQNKRLDINPLIDVTNAKKVFVGEQEANGIILKTYSYFIDEQTSVYEITDKKERTIAFDVIKNNVFVYRRIDILGDGSFILLEKKQENLVLPEWVKYPTPYKQFGI